MKKIILYRPKEWFNRKFKYDILLEEKPAGRIGPGETLELPVEDDQLSIQARLSWCGSKAFRLDEKIDHPVKLEVRANEQLHRTILLVPVFLIGALVISSFFPYANIIKGFITGFIIALLIGLLYWLFVGKDQWLFIRKL